MIFSTLTLQDKRENGKEYNDQVHYVPRVSSVAFLTVANKSKQNHIYYTLKCEKSCKYDVAHLQNLSQVAFIV